MTKGKRSWLIPQNRRGWRNAALRLILVGGLTMVGLFAMTRMPGTSHRGPLPPLTPAEREIAAGLRRHVAALAGTIGERNVWRPGSMDQAAAAITFRLQELGYAVNRQEFSAYGTPVANIEVERRGTRRPEEILVIGAHYDTVLNSPGANDNGSGVAALLELARLLQREVVGRTIRLVAFANEEPPFYFTGEMGSHRYAARCKARNETIVGMLALETMGCYTDIPASQRYPWPFGLFYPERGDFIAMVGNLRSRSLVRQVIASFRQHARFPAEGLAAPGFFYGIGWSDHWSFWEHGYPALMVTDTAFFRSPVYHTTEDTPEKLDYERLARVVAGIARVVPDLAR
ncbi:MAG: M28 family peptidase [Thermodesulfobacteriota bacterium]